MDAIEPKLLTIPAAAKRIGQDVDTVRAWTRRAFDPLPTVRADSGRSKGLRVHRRVVAAEIDAWLSREAAREAASCR